MATLSDIVLPVSNKLFVLTLSDLHYHTQHDSHNCSYLKVPQNTTLQLLPLHDIQPSIGIALHGFVLKTTNCDNIDWSRYKRFRSEKKQNRFLYTSVPGTSAVYRFLERELAHDYHIQLHFDNCRDDGTDNDYAILRLIEDHECSDCDYKSSGSEYSPSDKENEGEDEDDDDDNRSEASSVSVSELEGMKDDFQEMQEQHEKDRREQHRRKVDSWMENSKAKWERGSVSSDEIGYHFGSGMPYRKRKRSNRSANCEKNSKYCHSFNNSGMCHHGTDCWFRHEKAPLCIDDMKCTATMCGYYHNPKPQGKFIKQLEQIEQNIVKVKERKKLKCENNCVDNIVDVAPKTSFNATNLEKQTVPLAENIDAVLNEQDCTSQKASIVANLDSSVVIENAATNEQSISADVDEVSDGGDDGGKVNDGEEQEVFEDDQVNVDVSESNNDESENLWSDFLKNHTKPDIDYRFDQRKEENMELWKVKQVYMQNHGVFPNDWKDEIPNNNGFPLLFFLSEHPEDMDNVLMQNKREVDRCVVWNVVEKKNDVEICLGLAILTLTKYHRMPHAGWSGKKYDLARQKTFSFGDEILEAVGIITGFDESMERSYCESVSSRRNVFVKRFKELPHIPAYCSWVNEVNMENEKNSKTKQGNDSDPDSYHDSNASSDFTEDVESLSDSELQNLFRW